MTMGTDDATDPDNETSGDDSNTTDIDNRAENTPDDQQQQPRLVATTTSEYFTVPASAVEPAPAPATLKCRAFPHGVYSVVISFWTGFAWLM